MDDLLDSQIRAERQTLWTGLRSFYQRWLPPIIAISSLIWVAYSFVARPSHPPIGTYIATLAFLAVVVTIWPPDSRWSRAAWLVAFIACFALEVSTLYRDRAENAEEQAKVRKEERDAFQAIATGLDKSMANNQTAFDATLNRLSGLNDLSKESLGEITGGDSFCYFSVVINAGAGSPLRYPLTVEVIGRYPIRNITAQIQTLRESNDADSIRQQIASIHLLPVTSDTVLPGSHSLAESLPVGRYGIGIWTLNGIINESLTLEHGLNGELSQSIEVKRNGKLLRKEVAGKLVH